VEATWLTATDTHSFELGCSTKARLTSTSYAGFPQLAGVDRTQSVREDSRSKMKINNNTKTWMKSMLIYFKGEERNWSDWSTESSSFWPSGPDQSDHGFGILDGFHKLERSSSNSKTFGVPPHSGKTTTSGIQEYWCRLIKVIPGFQGNIFAVHIQQFNQCKQSNVWYGPWTPRQSCRGDHRPELLCIESIRLTWLIHYIINL